MERQRCSALSLALGEPLFATAPAAAAWLLVEQPGAWGARALTQSRLDPELGAELERRAKEAGVKLLLVKQRTAPTEGRRCFAAYSGLGTSWLEELALDELEQLLELELPALAGGRTLGGRRLEGPLYLVCTNGKRDACCASHGRPVASALATLRPRVAFECSHVGGHRFAANVVSLPHGLWYGRVRPDDVAPLVAATERGEIVLDRFRGRSILPPPAQAADWFVRERERLLGVDALQSFTSREANGLVEVELGGSGRAWRVRMRRVASSEPRPTSCADGKLERPSSWRLLEIAVS